ncbi:MAG: pur operon repressor [Christensenellales bacterium]|jgi:purine operon repressor
MDHVKRADRLGAITRILTSTPNRIHSLGEFCELFGAAKSTISEDIDIISGSIRRFAEGVVETIAGASGGVRFRAIPSDARIRETIQMLCRRLSEPGRMLPGGFLYTSDVTYESAATQAIGEILAKEYYDAAPDFVLTMETKGIPIAMMTARVLDIPLVIARRDSRAYEGSAVKINYIAGNGVDLETMALARRAVKPGQKALIADDFMKGGGTLRGMKELMQEFQVEVVGTGVMIATSHHPAEQLNVRALVELAGFDQETNAAILRPSACYRALMEET